MPPREPQRAIERMIDELVDILTRSDWERDDMATAKAVHEIGRLLMNLEARIDELERAMETDQT